MKKDNYIDLSDIKEDELDKTSTFTDLMSRSQRRAHEKEKRKRRTELEDENIVFNSICDNETIILEDNIDSDINEINNTITDTIEIKENEIENGNIEKEDENEETYKKNKIGFSILTGLFTLGSIGYYIYLTLYTNLLLRRKFFISESLILVCIILLFCINNISKKKIYKISSVFIYIFIVLFIILNILIKFKYIK